MASAGQGDRLQPMRARDPGQRAAAALGKPAWSGEQDPRLQEAELRRQLHVCKRESALAQERQASVNRSVIAYNTKVLGLGSLLKGAPAALLACAAAELRGQQL